VATTITNDHHYRPNKVKVKHYIMKAYRGAVIVLHAFLSSASDGADCKESINIADIMF
jgi:hypothetical protein